MGFESPQKTAATNLHNQKVRYYCAAYGCVSKALANYLGGAIVVVLPETEFFDTLREIMEELEAKMWFVRHIVSKDVLVVGDSKESVDELYRKQLDIKQL